MCPHTTTLPFRMPAQRLSWHASLRTNLHFPFPPVHVAVSYKKPAFQAPSLGSIILRIRPISTSSSTIVNPNSPPLHLAPSFFFLSPPIRPSFFPPLSTSKCPAFSASNFSVLAVNCEVAFFLSLFCEIRFAFLGLMTRVPRWGPVGLSQTM